MLVNQSISSDNLKARQNSAINVSGNSFSKKDPSKCRVLIVDSDGVALKIHLLLLQEIGFLKIDCVQNSSTAIQHVKNKSYSIILLDIIFPDGNAFELCQAIKEFKKNKNTPILAANTFKKDEINSHCFCLEFGIDGVITKPYVLDTFKGTIESWI